MSESRVAEHFSSRATQDHALRLGMWIFLASEALLFAGLFALYGSYHAMYPAEFRQAAQHNTIVLGTINTFVLITSSFTVALSHWAIRHGRSRVASVLLLATVMLGLAFLVIKAFEYRDHFEHGIYPGRLYAFDELPAHGAVVFYTLYYFMTVLHAIHVLVGMMLLLGVSWWIRTGRVSSEDAILLELVALYWHLVDVLWIFLWPILYLVR